jgi:uncharacterized membrane-anchored protein YitT (DUF2179 family)
MIDSIQIKTKPMADQPLFTSSYLLLGHFLHIFRPLRLEFVGALYYVTSRGERKDDIYQNNADLNEVIATFYPSSGYTLKKLKILLIVLSYRESASKKYSIRDLSLLFAY